MTRLALAREVAPEAARLLAEIVVDNPVQCAVAASAVIVAPRLVARIARPRTPLEAIALAVLLQFGLTYAGARLMGPGGLLELKLRDPDADSPDTAA